MEISFIGKKALVTGAGKGLGRDISKLLVKCGATVYALTRTQSDLDSLVKEEPLIIPICGDISDVSSMQHLFKDINDIELLVNSAGVAILESFLNVSQDSYNKIMDINVKGLLFISQIIAKKMIANGKGGSIVHLSSQASQVGLKDHTVYCASKGAVDQLTRIMALELGPYKIRVNAVNPTVVLTDMGRLAWEDPAKGGPMLDKIPLGRFAEMEDVSHAVVYLLSNKSKMINGVTLPVDGGFLAT